MAVMSFSVISVQALPPATACAAALVWVVDRVAASAVAAALAVPEDLAVPPSEWLPFVVGWLGEPLLLHAATSRPVMVRAAAAMRPG